MMQSFYLSTLMSRTYYSMKALDFSSKVFFRKNIGLLKEKKGKRSFYYVDFWGAYAYDRLEIRSKNDSFELTDAHIEGLKRILSEREVRKLKCLSLFRKNKKKEAFLLSKGFNEKDYDKLTKKDEEIIKDIRAFRGNPHPKDLMKKLPYLIEILKFNKI